MKNLILPLAFVFLWACGGKDSAMDSDYTQFKLEDTASIQKISINNNGGSNNHNNKAITSKTMSNRMNHYHRL